MKRTLTIFLCIAMLAVSVPATFAEGTYSELTLDSSSPLSLTDDGFIENIPENASVADLIANFKDKNQVTVTSKDGEVLSLLDTVGSDATVSYVNGEISYKTVALGDTNGDAKFSAKDVSAAVKKLAGFDNGICVRAINVNGDDKSNGKDVSKMLRILAGNNETFLTPYNKDIAEYENSGIGFYFTDIMNRYGQSETDIYGGSKDKVYRMAKNEIETAQMVFTSDADYSGMTLEATALTNEKGAEIPCDLYYGYYYELDLANQFWGGDWHNVQHDWFVDPIAAYHGEAFDLAKNQSKLFYARIHTYEDTEAGFYTATVNLKDSSGRTVKTATLRMYVWNFALSEETASASAFNIDYSAAFNDALQLGEIPKREKLRTPEMTQELNEMWYEFMLDNRLCSYELPNGQDDPKNEKYYDNPRVTSFCVVGGNRKTSLNFEQMADMFKSHADDEVWLEKAYIYTTDEPCVLEQFEYMQLTWDTLKELMPDIDFHIVTPLAMNQYSTRYPNGWDFAEMTAHSTNILCPQTYAFTPFSTGKMKHDDPDTYPKYGISFEVNQTHYDAYGDFPDRYNAWRETGDYKMWWYVCCSPEYPYANYFTSYRGEGCRVLLWQQYMNNIDGLLYWDVNFWNTQLEGGGLITKKKTNNGDGNLIYPRYFFGTTEMAPSVRFEYVRDSFEDFQYMKQLEEIIGRDEVMKFVNEVTTDMLHFTEDDTVIEKQRDNMGYILESMS